MSNFNMIFNRDSNFIVRRGYSVSIPKDATVAKSESGYTFISSNGSGNLNEYGFLHNENGHAAIIGGTTFYAIEGVIHREDGPAIIRGNNYRYLRDGKLHREDGPALFWDGRYEWCNDGTFHNVNGPALIHADGTKIWYTNGKIHNLSGPAVIHSNGLGEYFIEGRPVTKNIKAWCKKMKIKFEELSEADIMVYSFEKKMGA